MTGSTSSCLLLWLRCYSVCCLVYGASDRDGNLAHQNCLHRAYRSNLSRLIFRRLTFHILNQLRCKKSFQGYLWESMRCHHSLFGSYMNSEMECLEKFIPGQKESWWSHIVRRKDIERSWSVSWIRTRTAATFGVEIKFGDKSVRRGRLDLSITRLYKNCFPPKFNLISFYRTQVHLGSDLWVRL